MEMERERELLYMALNSDVCSIVACLKLEWWAMMSTEWLISYKCTYLLKFPVEASPVGKTITYPLKKSMGSCPKVLGTNNVIHYRDKSFYAVERSIYPVCSSLMLDVPSQLPSRETKTQTQRCDTLTSPKLSKKPKRNKTSFPEPSRPRRSPSNNNASINLGTTQQKGETERKE